MEPDEALAELDASTRRYRKTEEAHGDSREATIAAVIAALKAGVRPTEVVAHSPFTDTYVRRLAREHGVAPRRKGHPPAD